ncbi:MAG: hypothetical protein IH591_15270 [Bacteroidales bacterium]|nr:hypothetical protein [Bacteroidales bacterium]
MRPDRKDIKDLLEGYLAGNLNSEEQKDLLARLGENPDAFEDLITGDMPLVNPDKIRFPHKSRLLKSYADLPDQQFEYLCIAAAEGDLSADQSAELADYASGDKERSSMLNTYRHLHLRPEAIRFNRKQNLRKNRAAKGIIRLAAITLTAAASVAVVMLAVRQPAVNTLPLTAQGTIIKPETTTPAVSTTVQQTEQNIAPISSAPTLPAVKVAETKTTLPEAELHLMAERIEFAPVSGTPVAVNLAPGIDNPILAEIYYKEPVAFREQLSLKDHLAIAFRERLMGEDIPDASPLKAYEIAGVSITGINRLLGWEMNLDVSSKEKGEVNALAFSSRLIKFQTPVKKNVTDQ